MCNILKSMAIDCLLKTQNETKITLDKMCVHHFRKTCICWIEHIFTFVQFIHFYPSMSFTLSMFGARGKIESAIGSEYNINIFMHWETTSLEKCTSALHTHTHTRNTLGRNGEMPSIRKANWLGCAYCNKLIRFITVWHTFRADVSFRLLLPRLTLFANLIILWLSSMCVFTWSIHSFHSKPVLIHFERWSACMWHIILITFQSNYFRKEETTHSISSNRIFRGFF